MAGGPPHGRTVEFEDAALPHLGALFNLAFNLTRNRKDAEDLVQETYLRAFRFFDSYQPGTHIKAWLFRILRNTFINRYRAARVRPEEVDFDKVELAYDKLVDRQFIDTHQPPSPEKLVLDGVLDEEVEQAMAALPEEYRTVVIMALVLSGGDDDSGSPTTTPEASAPAVVADNPTDEPTAESTAA